jgi:hypothetical protein
VEKQWIDTEDGKDAVLELAALPETVNVLKAMGNKHIQGLVTSLVDMSVADPAKDRALIIAKAELDGARKMLKSILQLFEEAGRPIRKS